MEGLWEHGECWLYCERPRIVVTQVGLFQEDGQYVPIYACVDCLNKLRAKAHQYQQAKRSAPAS